MNFGRITTESCVNVAPPVDSRCNDPAFAISNPDLCPSGGAPSFIIKPAVALTCALGSIQFKAFTVVNGVETDVTNDATFSSGDLNVAMVGSTTGNATAMAAGETTITATYQGQSAQAEFTVLSGDTCCDQQKVALLVVVDTTKSMSQAFSATYSTKLDYAKAAATQFIEEINGAKDEIGLADLHGTVYDSIAAISGNVASVTAAVSTLAQTQDATEFYDGINSAIAELNAATADRRVLVLMSDGDDTLTGSFDSSNDPIVLCNSFKAQGGIVICLGIRASGAGFSMLSAMASGGFFINAYPDVEATALQYISGVKGYICAGDCTPTGDVRVGKGELDYTAFLNWNVDSGNVNLLGNGFFDYLPGNGLYVELAGHIASFGNYNGRLLSKNAIHLTAGATYRLTAWLAGNQRLNATPYTVNVRAYYINGIGNATDVLNQNVTITDYQQPFTPYAFAFTPPLDVDIRIAIQQTGYPTGADLRIGCLLNEVKLEEVTTLTTLFDDNFDNENETYVPPKCGQGSTWVWLPDLNSYGYAQGYGCYGDTCLDEPPGVQQTDPNPLPDIESGTAPPPSTTTYSSTKTVCAQCPTGSQQAAPLVPTMTGPTSAAGSVSASSTGSGTQPWQLFGNTLPIASWANVPNLPAWIQFQFVSPTTVTSYGIVNDYAQGYPAVDFQLQGSNDGVNWTTLDTQTGIHSSGPPVEADFSVASPQSFTYYRLYITGSGGHGLPSDNTYVNLWKMQFYGYTTATPQQVCATATATSTVSQQDADNKATAAAFAAAQAQLNCQAVFSSTQQYTATCAVGTEGNPNSVTRSATATSLISQADADAKALAASQAAAEAALDCTASTNTHLITLPAQGWNQPYMAPADPCPTVQHIADAGNITKAVVNVNGIGPIGNGDSFTLLLIAPDGTTVLLYYNNSGLAKAVNAAVDLVFDDDSVAPVPFDGTPLVSGTYQCSNGNAQPGLVIPPPCPNTPYNLNLSVLVGKPKAGSWSLWAGERLTAAAQIASWSITLT